MKCKKSDTIGSVEACRQHKGYYGNCGIRLNNT